MQIPFFLSSRSACSPYFSHPNHPRTIDLEVTFLNPNATILFQTLPFLKEGGAKPDNLISFISYLLHCIYVPIADYSVFFQRSTSTHA